MRTLVSSNISIWLCSFVFDAVVAVVVAVVVGLAAALERVDFEPCTDTWPDHVECRRRFVSRDLELLSDNFYRLWTVSHRQDLRAKFWLKKSDRSFVQFQTFKNVHKWGGLSWLICVKCSGLSKIESRMAFVIRTLVALPAPPGRRCGGGVCWGR